MPDRPVRSTSFVAFLWFLAAALSAVAVVVRYLRTTEIAWYLIAAAAFTLVMGITALKGSRSAGV